MEPFVGLEYNFDTAVSPFDWEKFSLAFMPYFVKALNEIRGEIMERIPVGRTGDARRGLVTTPPERSEFEIKAAVIPDPANVSSRYAYYVENGRAPGKMPPWGLGSSLLEWTQQQMRNALQGSNRSIRFTKLHKTDEGVTARHKGVTVTGSEIALTPADKQALQMSFLIARSIALHGTRRFRNMVPAPWQTGFVAGSQKAQQILEQGVREAFAQIQ